MSVYRFTMCYNHSLMLCSHAIIVQSRYHIPNLHLIICTYYPIVLIFYMVWCTLHFVLLKRHLKVVFHSILLSVDILFIRTLFIRIHFSFVYFSFVYFSFVSLFSFVYFSFVHFFLFVYVFSFVFFFSFVCLSFVYFHFYSFCSFSSFMQFESHTFHPYSFHFLVLVLFYHASNVKTLFFVFAIIHCNK